MNVIALLTLLNLQDVRNNNRYEIYETLPFIMISPSAFHDVEPFVTFVCQS